MISDDQTNAVQSDDDLNMSLAQMHSQIGEIWECAIVGAIDNYEQELAHIEFYGVRFGEFWKRAREMARDESQLEFTESVTATETCDTTWRLWSDRLTELVTSVNAHEIVEGIDSMLQTFVDVLATSRHELTCDVICMNGSSDKYNRYALYWQARRHATLPFLC